MDYSVYWIHYKEHTDPLTEGYIGITCEPKKRFSSHKNRGANSMVKGAIRKGAFMEILYDNIDISEAYDWERAYRPTDYIGWNVSKGGESSAYRRTEEQKKAHSERMKGKPAWNRGILGAGKGLGVKPCYYKGKIFPSMTEAAEHFDVTISAVSFYVKRHLDKQP